MNPIQELKQACKKHHIQDVTFICRNLMQFDDWAREYAEWEAVIPFNACFAHCRGTGQTKQLAKESCALQALPICQGFITDDTYNPLIKICVSGGNKIPGSRNKTPFICVPKFNVPIEYCSATAFNVSDAIRRCKENLDTMLSKVDESFESSHRKQFDDSSDEESEEEKESENDMNGKIITVTDDMIKHWGEMEYCKNCKCDNCAMRRPRRIEKEFKNPLNDTSNEANDEPNETEILQPQQNDIDWENTNIDMNGNIVTVNILGSIYKCKKITTKEVNE
jgi:hypothetical protein